MANKVFPYSLPPPVGGWNTRDPLDAMAPTDAVVLDNWFPTTGSVKLRKGYADSGVTGMGSGNVDTLAEYHSGATRHLLAAANGNIYNATSSGAATSLGSGFTSNQWQTANFSGRVFFVNGVDDPQDWDGSTLTATSWTGPSDITKLIGVNVFKNRLFFWEDDSQSFWYAGLNNITGTLTEFPLSRVTQFGGNLIAMGTWTHDGGNGADDYAVFIMSSGEVAVYEGTDPSSASTWALVGVYRIGVPLSARGVVKIGGDLLVMTTDDFVNLSEVLRNGQLGIASKLSGAIPEQTDLYADNFGWQATLYNAGNMLVYNIPTASANFHQYVVNLLTGAACRFTGFNARCWAVFDGGLYFGGKDGKIYQADTGNNDAGESISANAISAWSSLDVPVPKLVTAIRPILKTEGAVSYSIALGFDFQNPRLSAPTVSAGGNTPWGSPWGSPWGQATVISASWLAASGFGQSVATRLRVSAKQNVSWLRTDFRLEPSRNIG